MKNLNGLVLSVVVGLLVGVTSTVETAAAQNSNRIRAAAWEDRDEDRRDVRRNDRGADREVWRDRDDDRDSDSDSDSDSDRGRDWDDRDSDDDRWRTERERDRDRNGPAFCRSGAGHPVHGIEWCRERGHDRTVWDSRRSDDRRYDGDYDRRHADFHRDLDRRYEERMSRRDVGMIDQIQLRLEKIREHDRWHDRVGVAH